MPKTKKPIKKKVQTTADDIFLFPFKVKRVVTSLSQVYGWGIKQLNVPETWKITKGKDVTVMIIDTGYTDHPDVLEGMLKDKCKSFLSYEKKIDDLNGHSTHVCGIIGARDNVTGMVGVAPECNLITVKVLGEDGSGDFGAIRKALEYAIEIKPDVINMSLGSSAYDSKMHELIKKLHQLNIPVIAAAGNDGRGNAVNYPGKYPEVICVTAYDKNGNPASFNSTGPETDFSAPGVDIYSTWLQHEYAQLSGTSMATPFMAGVVALLLSKHRIQEALTGQNDCKTVDQVKEHLLKYADDKGVVGRDDTWGYGVVDVVKVIANDATETPTQPVPQQPATKPFSLGQLLKKLFGWFFK